MEESGLPGKEQNCRHRMAAACKAHTTQPGLSEPLVQSPPIQHSHYLAQHVATTTIITTIIIITIIIIIIVIIIFIIIIIIVTTTLCYPRLLLHLPGELAEGRGGEASKSCTSSLGGLRGAAARMQQGCCSPGA